MMDDRIDQMARSLQRMEQMMAQQNGLIQNNTAAERATADRPASETAPPLGQNRPLGQEFQIIESADHDDANDDGTITLEPGEEKALVSVRVSTEQAAAVLSVGANDEQDVRYALKVDETRTIGGWTESPLGVVNDMYSFTDELNAYVPFTQVAEYVAQYDPDATGSIDMVARMAVERQ